MVDSRNFQPIGDRLPPQNIEAEEAILGGILLDPEAIGRVLDILVPDAFSLESHKIIYQAALTLHAQSKPTDLMTVAVWLHDNDRLDKVGGQSKLAQLIDRTVSAVNIDQYAKLVAEKYLRRKLIQAGHKIVDLGHETATELSIVLDRAEQEIFGITQERPQQGLISIAETLNYTFTELNNRSENVALPGLTCNFYDLDAMTGGFQRSDLIIVAGRPSMGKCCSADTEIILKDGSVVTIRDIYKRRHAELLSLGKDWKFYFTQPSAFVDDGIKPVFRVTTRLGRWVETTLTHPYLTINGWRPLSEIKPGDKIAVPRQIDVFGTETLDEEKVKLLAYLIGDGCLTHTSPQFTNNNPLLQEEFTKAVAIFPGVKVRLETARGTRTPTLYATGNLEFIKNYRQLFAERLRTIIEEQRWSSIQLAQAIEVSSSSILMWTKGVCVPNKETFSRLHEVLGVKPEALVPDGISAISKNGKNSLTIWLQELGIWGKDAHAKTVPSIVFKLQRSQLALFLNRLFATDGWATVIASGQSQLGYCTVSEKLARQIQHLLLRFGIIAAIKKRAVKYKDERRQAWQLNITDAQSIKTFIAEIGIFGKEEALLKVQTALANKKYQTNCDLIPIEIWSKIALAKGSEPWTHLAQRAGIKGYSNIHVGKRALSREKLFKLAFALNDLSLQQLATSDVYWDEIVSIESVGYKQVYDLTIPETHNFVANDICVHNTSFALGIAHQISKTHQFPVAIFSLEMSKEQLVQRLLANEAEIESNRLRSGRISENEWERLSPAFATLSALPIYIDDSANISVTEMRSQARRLQAEQGREIGLILIDYLQLMEGGSDNRVQELSKITRNLKGLAREMNAPVIALSQLSRGVESRTNKRPMLSDLRESGSIEQDADLVIMLYRDVYYNPDSPDRDIAEVIIAKHRNGPTGTVKLLFNSQFTQFRNLAK
ncbi:replicative DNA helicase [Aerosakkonema funiforme]|uniref:replicative DNA helicase n=1 Tax=Aerosakkonema funiforme TaxID=1246630 RepID=UPI0035B6F0CA